jgi:hypothetical protein
MDQRAILIEPGASVLMDDVYEAGPPFDVEFPAVVYGIDPKTNSQYTSTNRGARTTPPQATEAPAISLVNDLRSYLSDPSRTFGSVEPDQLSSHIWMKSILRIRVQSTHDFVRADAVKAATANTLRERTLRQFDIRPVLPTEPNSPLRELLLTADWLAHALPDGVPYKERSGNARWIANLSDEENLKVGIDCSTAIWFLFTRSHLPYTHAGIITTADMIAARSPLAEFFAGCDVSDSPHKGDLLVYRNETAHNGHVVLVVDPVRRIAWGSHGYDFANQPMRTGVQYQMIGVKRDWRRWDRDDMTLVSCWRHQAFAIDRTAMPLTAATQ